MSYEATVWAWKQKGLGASTKILLLALANRADRDHRCFPSLSRIQEDTELNRRTVIKARQYLVDHGLISVVQQSAGMSCGYELHLGEWHSKPMKNGSAPGADLHPPNPQEQGAKMHLPESVEPGADLHPPSKNAPGAKMHPMVGADLHRGRCKNAPLISQEPLINLSVRVGAKKTVSIGGRGEGISEASAREWIDHRMRMKKPPTQGAFDRAMKEARNAADALHMEPDAVIAECIDAGWQGIKTDWLRNRLRGNGNGQRHDSAPRRETSTAKVIRRAMERSGYHPFGPDDPSIIDPDTGEGH